MVSKSGCLGWFQKRTNFEKTLLSVSSLLLLTLLLVILFGVTYHGKKSDKMVESEKVCWSQECIETAGDIISVMDPSADSCSNFYDFSCGRYGEEVEQTMSVGKRARDSVYYSLKNLMESSKNVDTQGFGDIKRFYESCVKFGIYSQDVKETKDSFLNLLSELGVGIWPIIDPLYDIEKFSLEHTLASLVLLDVPVVFQMEVVPDELLEGFHLIKISPGGPRESGRSPTDIRDDVQLRSSVLASLLLLGASAANTDVNDILSVDSSFAAIEQDGETFCDKNVLAPQEVLSELNRQIPELDWRIILSEIRNATGIVRPFAVELHCKQKIRDYVVHLNDLSLRSETNYLGWRFFSKFVDHVIPTFQRSQFGDEEAVPRWRVCLELLEKYSSPVLAETLTKKFFTKEKRNEIVKISKAVLGATQRLVSQSRWLKEPLKSRIREKVNRMKMSYPFREGTTTETVSARIPEVHVSNFTAVTIRQQRQWVINRFRRLLTGGGSSGSESWISLVSPPIRDSGFSDDDIPVHFDKIREPYFRTRGSQWLNYGAYGVAIAREISENLLYIDDSLPNQANVLSLWSEYKNATFCLTMFASQFGIDFQALPRQSIASMMEVVFLDHSAIEIAFESARSAASSSTQLPSLDLSDEKLFFLSSIQTLCDGSTLFDNPEIILMKDRLNSAISTMKTFNEVFSCTGPTHYCEIWT